MNISNYSNKEKLKFLIKDSSLYGIGIAISKSSYFILLPIISYHFTPEEYSIIDYFQVILQVLTIVTVFGIETAVARYYFETDDDNKRKVLISQSFLLQLIFIVVYIITMLLLNEKLNQWIYAIYNSSIPVYLIYLQVPLMVIVNFCLSILKWSFHRNQFLILSVGLTLTNFLLVVVFLNLKKLTIPEFFLIGFCPYLLFSTLGVLLIRKWLIIPSNINWFKKLIQYSFPLGLISVFSMLTPLIERSLIYKMIGVEQMAIFVLTAKIAVILMTIISAFQTSWGPFAHSLYKSDTSIKIYNLVLKLFSFGIFTLIILLTWLLPYVVVFVFSPDYSVDVFLLFIILVTIGLKGINWITEIGISFSKKTKYTLFNYIISFVISLITMLILVHPYGIYGIAIGTFIGMITKSIIGYYFAQKLYPLKWDLAPTLKIIFLVVMMFLSSHFVSTKWNVSIDYLIAIILFTFIFSGWKIVFSVSEKHTITKWLSDKLNIKY